MNKEQLLHLFDKSGVVIAAGGSSTRFGAGNKLFSELDGLPVFAHSLKLCAEYFPADRLVLVVSEDAAESFREIIAKYSLPQPTVAYGGTTRQESVLNGIQALSDNVEYVAVQDAARPFLTTSLLYECLKSTAQYGSGIAAKTVTDTIKEVDADGMVTRTLNRECLRATETPQCARRNDLIDAYTRLINANTLVTDEAQALEKFNLPVHLVTHSGNNKKITYQSDLID